MRNLLGLRDLCRTEIEEILTEGMRQYENVLTGNYTAEIKGRTMATLFYEPGSETRESFEVAAKNMGMRVISVETSINSVSRGGSLTDMIKTLESMGTDYIVLRHPMTGAAHLAAGFCRASVINGGDGINENPIRALLDMLTMDREKGRIAGLKVAIVGDILHSRVARSDIFGLTKLGACVNVSGPPAMIPAGIDSLGARVCGSVEEALREADVIMELKARPDREYSKEYCITRKRAGLARPGVLIMRLGTPIRGVEGYDIASSSASVIQKQVGMGVAVSMAVFKCLNKENNEYSYKNRLYC